MKEYAAKLVQQAWRIHSKGVPTGGKGGTEVVSVRVTDTASACDSEGVGTNVTVGMVKAHTGGEASVQDSGEVGIRNSGDVSTHESRGGGADE